MQVIAHEKKGNISFDWKLQNQVILNLQFLYLLLLQMLSLS